MKLYTLFILAFLLTTNTFSQENVSGAQKRVGQERATLNGKVSNEKGEPLPGASIYIHDIRIGTVANNLGDYTISRITNGTHLIEVTHQGYASAIENVVVSGSIQKNFTLSSTIVEQEGVTVTGVSSATRLRQSPQPVSLLKRADLLKASSTNLIDALTRKSGVSSISTGPAISKPVIRGLGYNRVVTINDGVRQEGQQWGDEHGIEIDEYSVQKAEILKGPASLMYGSDAMAGVINFLTNQPVEKGTFKGNILAATNTNNGLFGFNANLAAHYRNGFNWNIYSTIKSAGDFNNKYDGQVYNSRFNERNFGGYIGVNKGWGFSHLIITSVHQNLGLIEGDRDSATGKFIVASGFPNEHLVSNNDLDTKSLQTPYQTINHTKFALDNSFSVGTARLSSTIAYQTNDRQEFGNPEQFNVADVHFKLRTLNYNLGYHFAEVNGWRTSIGVNGMYQQNKNKAEERLIPEYDLFDIGTFVYAKKSFDKLTISGGIRGDIRTLNSKADFENNTYKFESYTRNFGNISGSVGLAYEASKAVVIKANIARGFRAPSIAELSSNGAHEGTNRYEFGQKDLKTEVSLQMDAGIEVNSEHLSFGLSAYYNNIDNYIFYRKLQSRSGADSIVNDNGEDFAAFKFNQSRAKLAGFEANFDIHPHPLDWLHFENTFSFVRGQFANSIEGSKNLPFIPAPKLLSELRADFDKVNNAFGNLYFKLEMDFTSRQNNIFSAYNTETPTPGYALLNVGTGADITKNSKKLFSIYMALNNATDVAYQNHLSRLKYTDVNNATGRQGVFNMGRNFNVKVNVPLDFSKK